MISTEDVLQVLTESSASINRVKDLDLLMEQILKQARRIVNADAGSVLIRDGYELGFSYFQNDTLEKRESGNDPGVYKTQSIPLNINSIVGYSVITGKTLNIDNAYSIDPAADYAFDPMYDELSGYKTQSILTVPFKTVQGKVIGAFQVINAGDPDGRVIAFSEDDERILVHFANLATVALERAKMTRTLIMRMARMAEFRDPKETGAHVNRVGCFSALLYERWARKHHISDEDAQKDKDILRMASMLHDVGKVAIADAILKKPRKLST